MKVRIPNQGGSQQEMLRKVQKIQEDIQNKQAELEETEYDVSSGGGMVKVKIMGSKEIVSIKIDPSIISQEADDVEMLEDMITAAVNEAIKTVDAAADAEMKKITAGMPNIPGLF